MKPGGHPIGLRLSGRMAELRNRLSRARYFRGHGVHSPFVYTIVREVFMRRELPPFDLRFPDPLRKSPAPAPERLA